MTPAPTEIADATRVIVKPVGEEAPLVEIPRTCEPDVEVEVGESVETETVATEAAEETSEPSPESSPPLFVSVEAAEEASFLVDFVASNFPKMAVYCCKAIEAVLLPN